MRTQKVRQIKSRDFGCLPSMVFLYTRSAFVYNCISSSQIIAELKWNGRRWFSLVFTDFTFKEISRTLTFILERRIAWIIWDEFQWISPSSLVIWWSKIRLAKANRIVKMKKMAKIHSYKEIQIHLV